VGGIYWPILIERLFHLKGFNWTHRYIGFIALPFLIISSLLVKERKDTSKHSQDQPSSNVRETLERLADAPYAILTAGFWLVYLGMFIPFYYIPMYGISHGMDTIMSNNLLAILNAGSFIGRIGSGILADKLGR
jgi:predicted MFS family arabinose efflux permease